MVLRRLAVVTALVLGLCGISTTDPARTLAQPACTYLLSAPQLKTLQGGAVQVAATLRVTSCADGVVPWKNVVCLAPTGANGRCAGTWGWNTAEVFLEPGGPAPYSSTGKGCVTSGQPPESICTPLGPVMGADQ